MRQKYTEHQKKEVFKLWNTGNYLRSDLALKLDIPYSSIIRILKQQGYIKPPRGESQRKYPVIHDFFEVINTEEKAYFLGLLYADGFNDEKKGIIQINLQSKDEEILKKFSAYIQPTKQLYYTSDKELCKMIICSKKMSKDLTKWGCVYKKSLILEFPHFLPDDLMSHFIRGFFDGDGCVMADMKKKVFHFKILSTKTVVENIQKYLVANCNLNITKIIEEITPSTGNIKYNVAYGGRRQLLRIRDYLYKDATIFLQRKYNRFFSISLTKR